MRHQTKNMSELEIFEFRKVNTNDPYDEKYDDGAAWSRVYEYRLVVEEMRKHSVINKSTALHNSSWGFEDLHIQFKDELDSISDNCIHSDIQESALPKTSLWNITKKPPKDYLEKFDVVMNVSTMEEVDFEHMKVFNNLLSQVKVGGLLICTFDLPGLQLPAFESRFERKLETSATDITGLNSKLQNKTYGNLSCGIMVLKKLQSTLEHDSKFWVRLLNL